MDLVQFSLCMLRRLPPDHPDPALAGKQQFKYTTLFEVKLLDLVKDGENTANMIGEAADKCTEEYPFMHALDSKAWEHVRGMILNELSARFSLGYLAADILGSKAVEKVRLSAHLLSTCIRCADSFGQLCAERVLVRVCEREAPHGRSNLAETPRDYRIWRSTQDCASAESQPGADRARV